MLKKEKKPGIIAGLSLIIMAVAAGFSYGYAHNSLVADAPEATIQNLIANKSLFLAALAGWGLIFFLDLVVAVALYYFFRNTSKQISLVTAVIRIVYTLILGIAIVQLFKIIPIISLEHAGSYKLAISETTAHLQLFDQIWSAGLIVFGIHLVGLGYLSVRSKSVPRLLGYLLYFGGICYIFLHSSRQLSVFDTNALDSIENILALPMVLAEILLAFWLVYNGLKKSPSKILS